MVELGESDRSSSCASRLSFAFVAVVANGAVVTWGESDSHGDSSQVQEQFLSL